MQNDRLLKVKDLLEKEKEILYGQSSFVDVTPILHNEECIILQFCGWSINLEADGRWWWEATDGG